VNAAPIGKAAGAAASRACTAGKDRFRRKRLSTLHRHRSAATIPPMLLPELPIAFGLLSVTAASSANWPWKIPACATRCRAAWRGRF